MKVTIEIPDLKFGVGDFVTYTETDTLTNLLIIARVYNAILKGFWFHRIEGKPWIETIEATYLLAIQEGSLNTEGNPLRPGMCLSPPVLELETYAELTSYSGRVWEPDNPDNIGKRWREWFSND